MNYKSNKLPSKAGRYDINGKSYYFRSGWEPNYALYLDYLKNTGHIKSWKYEPKTFWFPKIRRGVCSYLPDFQVILKNGREQYHEVKGWMDPKSMTKIKRMAKYYPEVDLIVIDKDCYTDIKHKMGKLLKFY